MKMLCSVQLSKHRYKTPEGYLLCKDAIIARTGKQTYLKSEIIEGSDSNEYIDVDRSEAEVFSPTTMASFENKPLTIEHPSVSVNPENYKELSVGNVYNIHKGDFEGQPVMLADILVTDAEAISLIESGEMVELSCGYDCDITDGPNPEQVNIRGNHIALCEQGRAGIARIQDSKKKDWGAKAIADSIQKGSLIQEFGKQGKQYKISKIVGNVIYAEELVSGKIILFKKDEENVEWASITKSEVKDSIEDKQINWSMYDIILETDRCWDFTLNKIEHYINDKYGYTLGQVEEKAEKGELMLIAMPLQFGNVGETEIVKLSIGYFASEQEAHEFMNKELASVIQSKKDNSQEVIKSYVQQVDKSVDLGDSMIDDSMIWDRTLKPEEIENVDIEHVVYGDNGIWWAKDKAESELLTKAYWSDNKGETWNTCGLYQKGPNKKDPNDRTQVGKWYFRGTSAKGVQRSIGRNVLTWYTNKGIHEIDRNQEIDHINNDYIDDRFGNLQQMTHSENVKKEAERRKQEQSQKETHDHEPKYAIFVKIDGQWKLWGGLEEDEVERKREVIAKYGKENVAIVSNKKLDEVKKQLNKVQDSAKKYIICLEPKDGESCWLDVNDKPTDKIELARKFDSYEEADSHRKTYCNGSVAEWEDNLVQDEEKWTGFDLKRGPASKEFKSYLRDRGFYFEPSENGDYVHFEVKNADEWVIQRAGDIREHWAKFQDSFSKKFYNKAIEALEKQLKKLDKNEILLDENQEDYEMQKNNLRKTIEKQIEEYKAKLEND